MQLGDTTNNDHNILFCKILQTQLPEIDNVIADRHVDFRNVYIPVVVTLKPLCVYNSVKFNRHNFLKWIVIM